MRLPLLRAGVKQILDLAQLPVSAHERRLQTLRLERAANAGNHAYSLPERRQSLLALQLVRARVLVHDRLIGRTPSRLADPDTARFCHRLDA